MQDSREFTGESKEDIARGVIAVEEMEGNSERLCTLFPSNFNDVDFCLKIQETGRSLIWTPLARLYHFETTTRVTTVTEEETQFIKDRWGRTFGVDLYRSRID